MQCSTSNLGFESVVHHFSQGKDAKTVPDLDPRTLRAIDGPLGRRGCCGSAHEPHLASRERHWGHWISLQKLINLRVTIKSWC